MTYNILDDTAAIARLDSHDMLADLLAGAAQCRAGWCLAEELFLPPQWCGNFFRQVLICGMGAAALAGKVVQICGGDNLAVPVQVVRSYTIPAWVHDRTLVFCVSHSGNTAETLECFTAAKRVGAVVIVLSSGGVLTELARDTATPQVVLPQSVASRQGFGYLCLPMLVIMHRLQLLRCSHQELQRLLATLTALTQQLSPTVCSAQNPAKQLALALHGKLPLIWGSAGITLCAAQRFCDQLAENAAVTAFYSRLPQVSELPQQAGNLCGIARESLAFVVLRDIGCHSQVRASAEQCAELWQQQAATVLTVWSQGGSPLSRVFYLMLLLDFTSVYAAFLQQRDPFCPCGIVD